MTIMIREEFKDDMLARGFRAANDARRHDGRRRCSTAFAFAPELAAAQEEESVKVRISSKNAGPPHAGWSCGIREDGTDVQSLLAQ